MPTIMKHNPFETVQDHIIKKSAEKAFPHHPTTPDECEALATLGKPSKHAINNYAAFKYHCDRGNRDEPLAKSTFCTITGHRLLDIHDKLLFSHPKILNGSMGVTPDGITYCGGILETKCPVQGKANKSKLRMYEDQILANMAVFDAGIGWLFQLQRPPVACITQEVSAGKIPQWLDDATAAVDEANIISDQWMRLFTESSLLVGM